MCNPQEAVARCFEREEEELGKETSYFYQAPRDILPCREKIAKMLQSVNMAPVLPEAGYFMIADISKTGTSLLFIFLMCKCLWL